MNFTGIIPNGTRVRGEGPIPSRLMLCGEFPGIEEGRRGHPFVGKSGRELMRFLNGYELPTRTDVYLTNLSKQVAPDAKSFTFSVQDERELWNEILAVRPSIIATLGHHATQYFIGDLTLEATHGIPHRVDRRFLLHEDARKAWGDQLQRAPSIFPGYNPAAMLHSPKLQSTFAYDMRLLALHNRGKLPPAPIDLHPGVYTLHDDNDADPVYGADRILPWLGCDTEGWTDRPWGISWSREAYEGRVVKAAGAGAFVRAVQRYRPRLVIHNALHDLNVLAAMGLDLDEEGIEFDDTMIMAYLLGLEPQGLKPLCYRHAGMLQDDYSDIVAEPNDKIAVEWLTSVAKYLPERPVKLTKKLAVIMGVWPADSKEKYEPQEYPQGYTEEQRDQAQAKVLIERMLSKGKEKIRKRWEEGRAREILVDEQSVLQLGGTDPDEATLDDIPEPKAVRYSGRDADATTRVYPYLDERIDVFGLRDVYQVDVAILPMVNRMQTVGLKVDVPWFESLSMMLGIEVESNKDDIIRVAGRYINPNSSDQVAAYLFDELKLQDQVVNLRIKQTKGSDKKEPRLTTNDKVLEAIKDLHPIVPIFQEGREIRKIKGTYSDPIPKLLGHDGRLHPRYRLTRTDTGRLSAGDPNVLAFPKHSKRGKLVRMGFVADDGHELGEWDLAQIEMCVFAHDSEDDRMIAEILSGIDKHAATASGIFGRPADVIYAESKSKVSPGEGQRFAAKAVNFGILMGITAHGLLDQFHKNGQLDYTLDRCQELLDEWFRMYPGAKRYIAAKHAEARRLGYVKDMWGRLRWLEGIHSHDDYIRAEAERQAQATPTQSGAQGIIKRAMRDVWPVLKGLRTMFWIEPLLQIHDAIVLEYDLRHRETVDQVMMAAMTSAVTLRVPVKASNGFGLRLGEL